MGSERWSAATARTFNMLRLPPCGEVAKPEWWNDTELKALSARVVRAAPNDVAANAMRADVLSGAGGVCVVGPRSAAELKQAAAYYERAAALQDAPAIKAQLAGNAYACRRQARLWCVKDERGVANSGVRRHTERLLRRALADDRIDQNKTRSDEPLAPRWEMGAAWSGAVARVRFRRLALWGGDVQ